MILIIRTGARAGERIRIVPGRPVVAGRSAAADLAFPGDSAMSSRHFEIRYDGTTCRVVDLVSSNGTRLNGVLVRSALARDGDEIEAGETVFTVQYMEQAEGRAALQAGGWRFYLIPERWEPVQNLGIQRKVEGRFAASVIAAHDKLPEGESLREYVDRQILVLRGVLPSPEFGPVSETSFPGMSEAYELEVRYNSPDNRAVLHRQCYGREDVWATVITETSLVSEWPSLRPVFRDVARNLKFIPPETGEGATPEKGSGSG